MTAGTYYWIATYHSTADPQATDISTTCKEAGETSVVAPPGTPLLETDSTNGNLEGNIHVVGSKIHDTAILSGIGNNTYTGELTFKLYDNDSCDESGKPGHLVTTVKKAVASGDGSYDSPDFTVENAGSYWWVASFKSTTPSVTDAGPTQCNDPKETESIKKAEPAISTDASDGEVTVGDPVPNDTAHLSGLVNPKGTRSISFSFYDNANCDGTPVAQDTVAVTTNGDYPTNIPNTTLTDHAGTYYWFASYSGDENNSPAETGCSDETEQVVVNKASPELTTEASGPVTVGSDIHDTATIEGLIDPTKTATINFKLYGPDDPTCTHEALNGANGQDVTVDQGNGEYESPAFTTHQAGSYHWVAHYSGDENNEEADSACGDEGETSVIEKAKPTIETNASGPVTVGSDIHDTATIEGLIDPTKTATINFKLYGPDDPTCTHEPLNGAGGQDVTVDKGNGEYESPAFTTHQAGSYHWVAHYSGDENNEEADSACGDEGETSVIEKAKPSIETEASGPVTVGSDIHDTATIEGLIDPTKTATINFKLYGPDDPTCTHEALNGANGQDVTVDQGNGEYESPAFTTHQAGSYHWVAHYSGDENNEEADSACGDEGETSVIEKATPGLATQVSAATVTVGAKHLRRRHPHRADQPQRRHRHLRPLQGHRLLGPQQGRRHPERDR